MGFFGVGMYATTYYSSVYALKKAFKEKEDVVSHHIVSGALTTALFVSSCLFNVEFSTLLFCRVQQSASRSTAY